MTEAKEVSEIACQVPLLELMRSPPATARLELETDFSEDGRCIGHRMIPVGRYLHEAASLIERQQAEIERKDEALRQAIGALDTFEHNGKSGLTLIRRGKPVGHILAAALSPTEEPK